VSLEDRIWSRFERALEQHAPREFAALAGPASQAEVSALERHIGVRLPIEVRTAYLRHNGTVGRATDRNASGFLFGSLSVI
jgi:cell wall assembly regulator SMI1